MTLAHKLKTVPKVELHLHIEGSLEPELMMALAERHQVDLPYKTLEEVQEAYNFEDLQSFLDLYYLGASVLIEEQDFYDLMWAYLQRCREENVVHTEIMFDPQTHTERGIRFEVFMSGFQRAIAQAEKEWGQSTFLIMSFLRHLSEESAIATLNAAEPYKEHIIAVGLDSSELGHPPEKFATAFEMAKQQGYLRVAHAGEEGPPEYIWGALDTLDVHRIDHGVRSVEDAELMERLQKEGMPLTVCPLSNVKLCVFDHIANHNIFELLKSGVKVTVNADDPSYFGGYLTDNYLALHEHHDEEEEHFKQLVRNSFVASFLPEETKEKWLAEVDIHFD